MKKNFFILLIVLLSLGVISGLLEQFGLIDLFSESISFMSMLGYPLLLASTGALMMYFAKRKDWFVVVAVGVSTLLSFLLDMEWRRVLAEIHTWDYVENPFAGVELMDRIYSISRIAVGIAFVIAAAGKSVLLMIYGILVIAVSLVFIFLGGLKADVEVVYAVLRLITALAPVLLIIYFVQELKKAARLNEVN